MREYNDLVKVGTNLIKFDTRKGIFRNNKRISYILEHSFQVEFSGKPKMYHNQSLYNQYISRPRSDSKINKIEINIFCV